MAIIQRHKSKFFAILLFCSHDICQMLLSSNKSIYLCRRIRTRFQCKVHDKVRLEGLCTYMLKLDVLMYNEKIRVVFIFLHVSNSLSLDAIELV